VSNVGQSAMFVGALFAGILADAAGPKITSCIGGLLFVLSYHFLGISSESVQLYVPYGLIQGLAIETSFFGVLSTPNLFPNHRGLMLAIMGSGRSLSMFYSIAMDEMTTPSFSMRQTAFTCMGISGFFTLVCFFCLPMKPFLVIRPQDEHADMETAALSDEEEKLLLKEQAKIDLREYLVEVRNPYFLCWLVAFAVSYARGVFYAMSVADQHPAMKTPMKILSPLSFLPCPFIGLLADAVGMLPVIMGLNTCGTIMFICLLSGKNLGGQWIAVLMSAVVLSFLASQNYVLIQEQYNENVRGKLAGTAMCVTGLLALVNTPIYRWGNNGNFQGANGLFMGLSVLAYLALGYMWFLRGPKPKYDTNDQGKTPPFKVAAVESSK